MKKIVIPFFILLLLITSCVVNVPNELLCHIVNAPEPIKTLGVWESFPTEGNANSITIELSRDVDFLAWTKENGEFISLPIPKGKKFPDTLKMKKGVRTFTFKEPGIYILNIHQAPEKNSGFNLDDKDFRGKVIIGNQPIKIKDTGYAEQVPKQGLFSIKNDSKCYSSGNVINEIPYVMYDKMIYDRKRKDNFGIYNVVFKYNNLNLKPGDNITLLFPYNSSGDTRRGGLMLKPVIKNGKTVYYGQTTNRSDRKSVQGAWSGQHNGVFYPIENNQFESIW